MARRLRKLSHEEFFAAAGRAAGFALEPGQLEGVRVAFDGQAPPEGSKLFAFGGAPPADALDVLVMPAGVRSGKSLVFGALKSVYQACTVDIRGLKPREEALCSFFAPLQAKATDTLAYALGIIEAACPEMLASKVDPERVPDEFWVRSPFCPNGPFIRFCAFGYSSGGINARGKWHVNSVLEEFAFAHGEGYKLNDAELYDAVRNRLWPKGGALQLISSPWAKTGKFYSLAAENRDEPKAAVVLEGATDALRTDRHTLELMAKATAEYERRGEPEIADREWRAKFLGLGSKRVYDDDLIKACSPWECGGAVDLSLLPGDHVVAGGDLAFVNDHAALVIVRIRLISEMVRDEKDGVYRPVFRRHYAVLHVEEAVPPSVGMLEPTPTLRGFAAVMRRFGVRAVMGDSHYIASLHEALKGTGIVIAPTVAAPDEVHLGARTAMSDKRVALLNDPRLLHQLTLVTKRPAGPNRWAIDIPRGVAATGGVGGHGDVAVAFATALQLAKGAEVKAPPPTLEQKQEAEIEAYLKRVGREVEGRNRGRRRIAP